MDSVKVILKCSIFSELKQDNIKINVEDKIVTIGVTEKIGDHMIDHVLPCHLLELYNNIDKSCVEVQVKTQTIEINLVKQEKQYWPRLGAKQWAWIKYDLDTLCNGHCDHSDEDNDKDDKDTDKLEARPEAYYESADESDDRDDISSSNSDNSYVIDEKYVDEQVDLE